jgi:transposase-like protein
MDYLSSPPEFWNKGPSICWNRSKRSSNAEEKKNGAFPNEASLLRLVGSILIDINEEWITDKRYLSVKSEMIS